MDTVGEIKRRLDIVQVVSGYVPELKKMGSSFRATCPFHSEKTPSFHVFPDGQNWHCFGACATGGDMFAFVMRKEGVDFKDALAILADKAGVPLVQRPLEEGRSEADRLRQINDAAAQYFHHELFHSPGGERARDYLARRAVSEKTMRQFQLGYSQDSWDALRQDLQKSGYSEDEMVAAGLLVRRESTGAYDRFRQRLMFPIREASGKVIGFGARALDDSLPKYLNSPQTPVFDKSGSLFGIDFARAAIRKENLAVVVEGYMDVIVAHQHGFVNVVASLGTALTEKHVQTLKKITNRLVLALDPDEAGEMATLRGIEVASRTFDQKVVPVPTWAGLVQYEEEMDAEIAVLVLPEGRDPDDVIRQGPGEWERLLQEAAPVLDYTFALVISRLNIGNARDKAHAVDQLLPLVAKIKHPVRQAHYLQKLARAVAVDEAVLASALRQTRPKAPGPRRAASPAPAASPVPRTAPGDQLAEYCLYLLFTCPDLRGHACDLQVDLFPRSEDRELFLAWRDAEDPGSLREATGPTLAEHLDAIMSRSLPPLAPEGQKRALEECCNRLKERQLRDSKAKEQARISAIEAAGLPDELQEIHEKAVMTNAQLREVFSNGKGKRKRGRN